MPVSKSTQKPKGLLSSRILGVLVVAIIGIPILIWMPKQKDFYQGAEWLLADVVRLGKVEQHEHQEMQFTTLTFVLKNGAIRRSSSWLRKGQVAVGDQVRIWYNGNVPPYVQILSNWQLFSWAMILLGAGLLLIWVVLYRFRIKRRNNS